MKRRLTGSYKPPNKVTHGPRLIWPRCTMTAQESLRTGFKLPCGIERQPNKGMLWDNAVLVGYYLMGLKRHETSAKHLNGIGRLLNRATPRPKTTLASCMRRATEYHKI